MGRKGGGVLMYKRPQEEDPFLKYQPESSNPSMKRTKLGSEIATELTNLASSGNKILDIAKTIPRRSQRIQNITSSEIRDIEPVFENIEASESEEGHHNSHEKRGEALEETLGSRTMEEKIDKMVLILEEQGRTIEALFSKGADWSFPMEGPTSFIDTRSEMRKDKYKNMYIDSQKKINDLKKENFELSTKLETALAKLDGYEKGQLVLSETIDKLKEACLVSNLTKTMEMALGLSSSNEILGHFATPASLGGAKRRAKKPKTKKNGAAADGAS